MQERTLKQHQIKTQRPYKEGSTPRMPHERDESNDEYTGEVRDDIKQAYKDIESGQVDTDLRETGGLDEAVTGRPGTPPDKVVKKDF